MSSKPPMATPRTKKVTNNLHNFFEGFPSSEGITDLIDCFTRMRDAGYVKIEMNLLRNGSPIYNTAEEKLQVHFSGVKYIPVSDDEYLNSLGVKFEHRKEIYEILKSQYEN